MPGVRARFVRELIELIEREHGREALVSGLDKLSARVGALADIDVLRSGLPGEGLPATEAEELLLGLDAVVGDGSGRLLEKVATEVFARLLGPSGLAVHGDLMASAARLQAPLEHLFIEQHILFDIAASSSGFSIFLGVPGRPRAARLLRHLAAGALRAAQRFAREGLVQDVKIVAETIGDRVRLDVKLREATDAVGSVPPPLSASARPPVTRRSSKPHLASTLPTLETVERIIARASISPVLPNEPLRRPSEPPRASTPPPPPLRPPTDPSFLRPRRNTDPTMSEPIGERSVSERPKTDPSPAPDAKRSGMHRVTSDPALKAPPSKKLP